MENATEAPKKVPILAIMVVTGVVLGPVYLFYCITFGGSQVGTYTIAGAASKWPLSDGKVHAFPSGRAARPIALDLNPAMNPIRLNWVGTVYGPRAPGVVYNQYRASLLLRGRTVLATPFSVEPGDKPGASHNWFTIAVVNLQEAGRYDLVIEQTSPGDIGVGSMEVEIRRNALTPVEPVLWVGWGLLATGVVLFLFREVRTPGGKSAPIWRLGYLIAVALLVCAAILGSFVYFFLPESQQPPALQNRAASANLHR